MKFDFDNLKCMFGFEMFVQSEPTAPLVKSKKKKSGFCFCFLFLAVYEGWIFTAVNCVR